jgi:hypothetical protein
MSRKIQYIMFKKDAFRLELIYSLHQTIQSIGTQLYLTIATNSPLPYLQTTPT